MRCKRIALTLACLLLLFCAGCAKAEPTVPAEPPGTTPGPGTVTITFDFEKQSGHASNQFAVWIGDMDGGLVKTLYATKFTAAGGYKNRPDSLAVWVSRALGKTDFDAVAGATPKAGAVSYTWDLTDEDGNTVPAGRYKFLVEGTLRWKNSVQYTGEIDVGGADAYAQASPVFVFEGTQSQPALGTDAPERGMISNVTAEYNS